MAQISAGESRAYFRPLGDCVMLPNFETFENADAFYESSFHELTHNADIRIMSRRT
jgi:antirestriction protein ArdC